MNFKGISNLVTSKVMRQSLVIQKHSPAILLGTGVAGFVTTVVLATRATMKLDEVLQENEKVVEKVVEQAEQARKVSPEKYSEEDKDNDLKLAKIQIAIKVVKLYTPAVAVGMLSIAALTGSHIILTKRNAAVTAAYAALDKGFREYRARVVNDLGAEKDAEYRYGLVEKTEIVEGEEVPVAGSKHMPKGSGRSIYARCFDEGNKHWQSRMQHNQMFINSQQNWANDLLRANGHVFLNEIYDMLGFERTKEGSVVGWVSGNGDDYIDFGIFDTDTYMGKQFVNGDEPSVWLDFNVDGIIYDKI